MYNMMNYDPDTLATKQLVDLRFLLHKAHHPDGSNSGLFIMGLQGYVTTNRQRHATNRAFHYN